MAEMENETKTKSAWRTFVFSDVGILVLLALRGSFCTL